MKTQPDELFRNKLESYQRPAPQSAWDKIASQQAGKKNRLAWMRVAASLLLLSVAGYIIWQQTSSAPVTTPAIAEESTSKPATDVAPPQENVEVQTPDSKVNRAADAIEESAKENNQVRHIAQQKVDTNVLEKQAVEEAVTTVPALTDIQRPDESTVQLTDSKVSQPVDEVVVAEKILPVTSTPASLTLVYTKTDVNDYRDNKYATDATSGEKKPSTLMKLLRKANELTNNQDPLGELRQKKNEILALNFKSDKQRGQNK